MALVASKGYAITPTYQQILPVLGTRKYFEVQNQTDGKLYITVGGSEDDVDALIVQAWNGFWTSIPMGNEIKMRSEVAGNVVVITEGPVQYA